MNYIHDLPAVTKKLVYLIDSPNIGINMDYSNTVYFLSCSTLEEEIELYGNKLFYTYLKNAVTVAAGGCIATALSEGVSNHRLYLKKFCEVAPAPLVSRRPGPVIESCLHRRIDSIQIMEDDIGLELRPTASRHRRLCECPRRILNHSKNNRRYGPKGHTAG